MAPDFDKTDDAELLLLLSNGDKTAFDMLYDKYWKQVYNAAFKRLNDNVKAQDIAQDVFVQLWIRAIKSPIDNLPAYLRVAARNGAFKLMEKDGKFTSIPDYLENLNMDSRQADSEVLHAELLLTFFELVRNLPPQQQVIFNLRFNDGLSSAQIAEKLSISPKTVRNQMGKALSTLRKSLFLSAFYFIFFQN